MENTLAIVPFFAVTDVVIPVGDWANSVMGFITTYIPPIVAVLATWLFRNVPAAYVNKANRDAFDHLAEKAIQFGLNTARMALPANATITVTNDLIGTMAKYAIENGPKIVAWAGGAKVLEDKILARLNVQPATGV